MNASLFLDSFFLTEIEDDKKNDRLTAKDSGLFLFYLSKTNHSKFL